MHPSCIRAETKSYRVIADARIGFHIIQGYAITFIFGTEDVVAKWVKMTLPYSEVLQEIVHRMQADTPNIGFNFMFELPEKKLLGMKPKAIGFQARSPGQRQVLAWCETCGGNMVVVGIPCPTCCGKLP